MVVILPDQALAFSLKFLIWQGVVKVLDLVPDPAIFTPARSIRLIGILILLWKVLLRAVLQVDPLIHQILMGLQVLPLDHDHVAVVVLQLVVLIPPRGHELDF